MELPLFPLKTVLLPHNSLALKIFEPRYIDLIARCLRDNQPFGVVLIHSGEETDKDIEIFSVGTSAMISDWQQRDDGLLGITIDGKQRFEIQTTASCPDGLLTAEVSLIDDCEKQPIPEQFYYMLELLNHVSNQERADNLQHDFNIIVYQLIYLLPLENALKQQLLEVSDCHDRAVVLHAELIRLGIIQYIKPGQSPFLDDS